MNTKGECCTRYLLGDAGEWNLDLKARTGLPTGSRAAQVLSAFREAVEYSLFGV